MTNDLEKKSLIHCRIIWKDNIDNEKKDFHIIIELPNHIISYRITVLKLWGDYIKENVIDYYPKDFVKWLEKRGIRAKIIDPYDPQIFIDYYMRGDITMSNDKEIWGYCIHYKDKHRIPHIQGLVIEYEDIPISLTMKCPKQIFDMIFKELLQKDIVIGDIDIIYQQDKEAMNDE